MALTAQMWPRMISCRPPRIFPARRPDTGFRNAFSINSRAFRIIWRAIPLSVPAHAGAFRHGRRGVAGPARSRAAPAAGMLVVTRTALGGEDPDAPDP